jgi:UDP-N-acetylmuramate dehydrogenase
LEFAHGIPGTLGGAIYMNAGAYGGSMDEVCVATECYDLDSGRICTFRGAQQAFGYRTSVFEQRGRYVILGAELSLKVGDPSRISAQMRDYWERRKASQPLEFPSAGSVFKRPEGHFAGKLIEDCGLKGLTVGGAQVSEKHAGFIINRGSATCEDVKRLVEQIQAVVLERTGVTLECEIRFL